MKWYEEIIEDQEWLQYLVKYNEDYGILALIEIDHPSSEVWSAEGREGMTADNPEWRKLSGAQIWVRLNRFCEKLQNILQLDVF